MYRCVLLCLALFVGSASAWGWLSKNRPTVCGYFKTNRAGWLFEQPVTDVDTKKFLHDFYLLDLNKDGNVDVSEALSSEAQTAIGSNYDLTNGTPRCKYVQFQSQRYGIKVEVASALFDILDGNGDFLLSSADLDPATFGLLDTDGDGAVSVCEDFRGFLGLLAEAEHRVFVRETKYNSLVSHFRKPWSFKRWLHKYLSTWF